ncbi:anti-sigma factor [Bradyrhizobium sp. WYCCWR 13023]|uniref:Anti-sigma factor n=1 Tax=Bradyrhizobium zhengyangense TaxID=2911009 RepID=A0A9X1RCA7_9BRAD|nr:MULTISPECIES: anti-sigma factor [Bradyrhizobium]MCG2628758.1 anti-sigma factor [Bradyrhizobium zhengyangense]MCG2644329.1 anti-sigma factor [Bradyrhizobium zhengyangense]MCG2668405.1 anti-sigma factor [Bradyrhizobium zhengyangense]MDA9524201.1 membrane protein [Bradyrhizobium sp. CCBAU 11434]
MSQRPITEDDLHAYVDQALEPERRAEVASYLDDHPDVAGRVAAFTTQREQLRGALASIADEPLPAELNLSRIIENRARRPVRGWGAIAAVLLLGIGAVGGWSMRSLLQEGSNGLSSLAQEAAYSYNVYAPDRVRPVEIRASDSAELTRWVSNRLQQPIKVPDLSVSGYRLMGGRLVATSHGPAAMFMYDDDRGDRLVVLTRPMSSGGRDTPMLPHVAGDVAGFAWADRGMGYTLVGQLSGEILKPIANEIRKQAGPI